MKLSIIETHIAGTIAERIIPESVLYVEGSAATIRQDVVKQVAKANDEQWEIDYRHPEGEYITDQDYLRWVGTLPEDRLPVIIVAAWEMFHAINKEVWNAA